MKFPGEITQVRRGLSGVLLDWVDLTKARIGLFVLFSAWVGAALAISAGDPGGSWLPAVEPALYIFLVGAGSSIFNQVYERETDKLMERTADRPLPAGRVRTATAIAAGALLGGAGTIALALTSGSLAALLALGTLVGYSLVYTPLKRVTTHNTLVGAIPGAMPPLLGFVAVAGEAGHWGWYLFLVIFVWQFPHFMAIAWIFRDDYRAAGMKMLPSLPGAEGLAGRNALMYSLVLIPVSLYPGVVGQAGPFYLSVVGILGLVYAGYSLAFCLREDRIRARRLLLASLVHLPLLLIAALIEARLPN